MQLQVRIRCCNNQTGNVIFLLVEFVQSLHGISFGDVEHKISQRELTDVLIDEHITERET